MLRHPLCLGLSHRAQGIRCQPIPPRVLFSIVPGDDIGGADTSADGSGAGMRPDHRAH